MSTTILKLSRYSLLTILNILLFVACQKDDVLVETSTNLETADHNHNQDASYISFNEIPQIEDYLYTKSNDRGTFEIDKSIYNKNSRSSEPDLVITSLQTDEILRITDGVRSNYTFLLTSLESNDHTGINIFNLIVVENEHGLFSYITEYRPTSAWHLTYREDSDFSTFSGEMLYFTTEGTYLAKATLDQGIVTSAETRNPCDPNDTNNDTSDGGGGDGGPGDGDSGDSGDGDSGNGGVGITVYTRCCYDVHNSSDDPDCTCGDIPDIIIISNNFTDPSNNNENHLLDPCDDIIVDNCYQVNGDPCPYGCNPAGDGCADAPDDNDNPIGIGVMINIVLVNSLNEYLENDLTQEQIDWIFENAENLAFAQYALEILNINPEANPFIGADCSSFEYAQPPGALQKGCAVTDFNHSFYTGGIGTDGNPYYGEVISQIPLIYFTMPTFMTNGQAANLTAEAVTNAIRVTDLYFYENPYSSEFEVGDFFRDALISQISLLGGSVNTNNEPFPIPNPAPYLTNFFGAKTNCN